MQKNERGGEALTAWYTDTHLTKLPRSTQTAGTTENVYLLEILFSGNAAWYLAGGICSAKSNVSKLWIHWRIHWRKIAICASSDFPNILFHLRGKYYYQAVELICMFCMGIANEKQNKDYLMSDSYCKADFRMQQNDHMVTYAQPATWPSSTTHQCHFTKCLALAVKTVVTQANMCSKHSRIVWSHCPF